MDGSVYVILGSALVFVLVMNPETLQLALLIDVLGLELFLFLLQIQFFMFARHVLQRIIQPVIRFYLGFSMHSLLVPNVKQIAKTPSLLTHLLPPGACLMFLLSVFFPIYTIHMLV